MGVQTSRQNQLAVALIGDGYKLIKRKKNNSIILKKGKTTVKLFPSKSK